MRHFASLLVVAVSGALLAGCGYIGDPLPPALNIPTAIKDMKAVERGDGIVIDFTVPETTIEDLPLKRRGDVELLVDERPVAVPAGKFGPVTVVTPAAPFVGRDIVVRARVFNLRGRPSDWSNMAKLRVAPPLAAPRNLSATGVPEGVKLTWQPARESSFRVFRGKESIGTTDKAEWIDSQTEYGKTYEYSVQAVLDGAESEVAGPAGITPEDKFPPAAPAGIQVLVGADSIELAWDRNTEADLKGYRIYRAVENGAFRVIAELVESPSFSDKQLEAGKKYRYAVTALDQKGNESPKSEIAEITAP